MAGENDAGATGGAGGAAVAGATGGDELATVKAELAAFRQRDFEREAAAVTAQAAAAAAAEVDRVAKLSAEQRASEELTKQRGEIEAVKAQLTTERRQLALDRLGVVDKFRAFAPSVDPNDPTGAAALEAWAKANPELLRPASGQQSSNSPLDLLRQKAGSALQKVLTGERKSTLVTSRNLAKLR